MYIGRERREECGRRLAQEESPGAVEVSRGESVERVWREGQRGGVEGCLGGHTDTVCQRARRAH